MKQFFESIVWLGHHQFLRHCWVISRLLFLFYFCLFSIYLFYFCLFSIYLFIIWQGNNKTKNLVSIAVNGTNSKILFSHQQYHPANAMSLYVYTTFWHFLMLYISIRLSDSTTSCCQISSCLRRASSGGEKIKSWEAQNCYQSQTAGKITALTEKHTESKILSSDLDNFVTY